MRWGILGSIGRGVQKAGRGLLEGIDNAAMNSLTSGGLLDDALAPYQVQGQQQRQIGTDEAGQPMYSPQQEKQKWAPTQQEKRSLRGSYLMSIGAALQQGKPIGEGVQQYQQNAIGQIQAGQQAQQQNRARQVQQAFQQEMQGAAGEEAQMAVLRKFAANIGPDATEKYARSIKEMRAPVNKLEFRDLGDKIQAFDPVTGAAVGQPTSKGLVPSEHYLDQGGMIQRLLSGVPTGAPYLKSMTPGEESASNSVTPLSTAQGFMSISRDGKVITPMMQGGKQLMPFRAPVDNSYRDAAIGNQSYNFHTRELDTIAKPVTDALARSSRLIETLNNGSPTALAAAVPEFLTVMAGGAGSGLRMTNAEISSIVGSRSAWDDLVAKASKFSSDPQQYPLTAIQVKNIRDMATAVTGKLLKKQQIINDGYQSLLSPNMIEHKQGVMKVRQGIANIDMDGQTKGGGGPLPVGWSATVRR
jgi:hypothetical protein